MPSFQDSAVIFIIALLLFGPKKLPELARQLGKLMGEFRRASNDFRMQMEDELRMSEQAERQKEIAAIAAAAPLLPAAAVPAEVYPVEEHPHLPPVVYEEAVVEQVVEGKEPVPIASAGDLQMMPPQSGLPVGRGGNGNGAGSALQGMAEAIEEPGGLSEGTVPAPVPPPDRSRADGAGANGHG